MTGPRVRLLAGGNPQNAKADYVKATFFRHLIHKRDGVVHLDAGVRLHFRDRSRGHSGSRASQ